MLNIIIHKFKEQYIGLLYYLIGLSLYAWLITAVFPSVSTVKADYLQQMPENMLKFFGGSFASMMTFSGFISMEFLALFFVLIIAFFVGSCAGSSIAGLEEKRLIDFELSQPLSRTKLLISNVILGLISIAVLTLSTSGVMYLLSKLYGISELSEKGILSFAVTATFFMWAIFGLGIFLTSIMKSKIRVASTTILITMGFYIFTSMTRIVDKLKDYEKLSPFYLYDPQKLLDTGNINTNHLIILFAIFTIGLISSLIIFNRKDI